MTGYAVEGKSETRKKLWRVAVDCRLEMRYVFDVSFPFSDDFRDVPEVWFGCIIPFQQLCFPVECWLYNSVNPLKLNLNLFLYSISLDSHFFTLTSSNKIQKSFIIIPFWFTISFQILICSSLINLLIILRKHLCFHLLSIPMIFSWHCSNSNLI